jgi:hypothetical protein
MLFWLLLFISLFGCAARLPDNFVMRCTHETAVTDKGPNVPGKPMSVRMSCQREDR